MYKMMPRIAILLSCLIPILGTVNHFRDLNPAVLLTSCNAGSNSAPGDHTESNDLRPLADCEGRPDGQFGVVNCRVKRKLNGDLMAETECEPAAFASELNAQVGFW